MSVMSKKIRAWVDHRTGLETAVRSFLYEDIPASSGWHQVFGSVALFLFLVQAFTGILLAFNYAPTPGDAYDSLKYIITQVPAGRMLHALHHWGATMMIVVVVLHMIQVFLYGAYKKPREATWMIGVVLLLVTLGFCLTGYLLPWDNRAYWGTVVTTQIASQAPLLGPYMDRLLGGSGGVGVVTFARFFGLHVLILPALLAFLIVFHVYLVRKHGVTPAPGDGGPPKKFFPEQVLKDTLAIFIAFVILFVVAIAVQAPLERLADPTDTTYIPRPDWYFLFLFQLLKFFRGSWEPMGSVVLPTLGVLALFLIPFVDRCKVMKLSQRTVAFVFVGFAGVGWTALTLAALMSTPKAPAAGSPNLPPVGEWNRLSPAELAGLGYFRDQRCSTCHNLAEGPPKIGPNLAGVGNSKDAAWMIAHFKDPAGVVPGTAMPPIHLTDDQLNALAASLLKLTPEDANRLADVPSVAVRGAQVFVERGCGSCHMINGIGAKFGPSLNGVAGRHTKEWVEKHFENPSALTPASAMPAFKFSPEDMNAIVSYLFSLPG